MVELLREGLLDGALGRQVLEMLDDLLHCPHVSGIVATLHWVRYSP